MIATDIIKPVEKPTVMSLVEKAGIDVSDWKRPNGSPANNPKYCYNWSFEKPGECIVVCLWYESFIIDNGEIVYERITRDKESGRGGSISLRRSRALNRAFRRAYIEKMPVRVIVVDGKPAQGGRPAAVRARMLDDVHWFVTKYDEGGGRLRLVRGAAPPSLMSEADDVELSWFEGALREAFVLHRQRESRGRQAKIEQALRENKGRLVCEVKGCGFDFVEVYGCIGKGYAQVHHLFPISKSPKKGKEYSLLDLAIVCANCHAMIHRDGECRPLDGLIPRR